MLKTLKTNHGQIKLPIFFPDATQAVVKGGVDTVDLNQTGVEGIVINTLHLSMRFDDLHQKLFSPGDIHQLMNWKKPIITDSGGFQVMSLIHNHPKLGTLTDDEAIFFQKTKQEKVFDAEKSIQIQLKLGADILICLDDCTKPQDPLEVQEKSVQRTISWAKRSKKEFERLTKGLKQKPLIFAVVQGGHHKDLRKRCAQALIEIGFDGYCYGGWPINQDRKFMSEIVEYTCVLLPDNRPKYAMGVGTPQNIVDCFKMGYTMFDCVIPTREARHKRLYIFKEDPNNLDLLRNDFYTTLSLQQSHFRTETGPISKHCDCLTCQNYSLSYLYHLFKIKDVLALRLATIHNLRFYAKLMERLKLTLEELS